MERAILQSPIDGNVIKVLVKPYEYAGTGQPVLEISDADDLSVHLSMDEIDVAKISMGDKANVTFQALPGETAIGVVTLITSNPNNDNPNRFIVELKLLDVLPGLRWGMSAEAKFE
jgi:HlyD family secretion protein